MPIFINRLGDRFPINNNILLLPLTSLIGSSMIGRGMDEGFPTQKYFSFFSKFLTSLKISQNFSDSEFLKFLKDWTPRKKVGNPSGVERKNILKSFETWGKLNFCFRITFYNQKLFQSFKIHPLYIPLPQQKWNIRFFLILDVTQKCDNFQPKSLSLLNQVSMVGTESAVSVSCALVLSMCAGVLLPNAGNNLGLPWVYGVRKVFF